MYTLNRQIHLYHIYGINVLLGKSKKVGNKKRSYVMQQHTKYPDKFLPGSIDKISIVKGT